MGKLIKWIFFALVGLFVVGSIIESNKTPEQKAAEQRQRQEAARLEAEHRRDAVKRELASLPSYTAGELARAYEANTVAADAIFKGKKFKVSGVVADISTDIFGSPYLTLRGGVNEFMEPQFKFDESSSEQLAALRRGVKVEVVCVGVGDVAKTPMSDSCVMP